MTMATRTSTIMTTTTTDLLTLTQWLSPAFPLGAFAYSHGLETEIAEGRVTTAGEVEDWLRFVIVSGTGKTDATLLCSALAGRDMLETARALAASKERSEESEAQGAAFAQTVQAMGCSQRPGPLPVVLGEAARALDLPPQTVAALYLQGFASNLVACAVRFVPLGQAEGQAILQTLQPDIVRIAAQAALADIDTVTNAAYHSDLAAMAHETLQPRLYRT